MTTALEVCQGKKVWKVGRLEINLKCQVGIHRGGKCRMALDGVIIMFEPEDK